MTEHPDADGTTLELGRAIVLADNRSFNQAKTVLLQILDRPESLSSEERFRALLTLARCCRFTLDLDDARRSGHAALDLARATGSLEQTALALEGLAITEGVDHRVADAGTYFIEAATLEFEAGNLPGMAATLSNYANLLIREEMEGAESLLRRAEQNVGDHERYAASIFDNLALEMSRQGRHAEAVSWGEQAIAAFERLDSPYELFISLRNLASNLFAGDRAQEAGRVYVRAHDLIHELRARDLDTRHYLAYPERVAQIEAATIRLPDAAAEGGAIFVGLNAWLGQTSYDEGQTLLEAGRASAAVEKLLLSRTYWEKLEALHMTVRVDHHLALAYTDMGDLDQAIAVSYAVRQQAHALGDAERELAAISNLVRMRHALENADALDLLAQGAVLERLLAGAEIGNGTLLEARGELNDPGDGVLASLGAALARESGADELATAYFRHSIRAARHLPEGSRHRMVFRLVRYLEFLTATGASDEAVTVQTELESAAEGLEHDARVQRALLTAGARRRHSAGERSVDVLRDLMLDCETYEEQRAEFLGATQSGLEEFSARLDPPYAEAAEVAVALGHVDLAMALADRGRAWALRRALELPAEPFPRLEPHAENRPATATTHGTTVLPASGMTLILHAGQGQPVVVTAVDNVKDPAGASLADAVERLTRTADSERGANETKESLHVLLEHPGFQRLVAGLDTAASNEPTPVLSAHSYLVQAPLHIRPAHVDAPERAWVLAPSLALASHLHARVRRDRPLVAFGDPGGDLPFARAEALLVGGAGATVGQDCTVARLDATCAEGAAVLHLACHGRYDVRNPGRSGLVLAPGAGEALPGTTGAHLLTTDGLGALALKGALVVLSACSSGLELVRGGETTGLVTALLKGGAGAIVAARWPVPDHSAMFFMVDFHERVTSDPQAPVAELLAQTRAALRQASAAQVVERGFEMSHRLAAMSQPRSANLVATGFLRTALLAVGDRDSAKMVARLLEDSGSDGSPGTLLDVDALRTLSPATAAAAAATPFEDPVHWGAFVVVGGSRSDDEAEES